jgi:hypothetical protein
MKTKIFLFILSIIVLSEFCSSLDVIDDDEQLKKKGINPGMKRWKEVDLFKYLDIMGLKELVEIFQRENIRTGEAFIRLLLHPGIKARLIEFGASDAAIDHLMRTWVYSRSETIKQQKEGVNKEAKPDIKSGGESVPSQDLSSEKKAAEPTGWFLTLSYHSPPPLSPSPTSSPSPSQISSFFTSLPTAQEGVSGLKNRKETIFITMGLGLLLLFLGINFIYLGLPKAWRGYVGVLLYFASAPFLTAGIWELSEKSKDALLIGLGLQSLIVMHSIYHMAKRLSTSNFPTTIPPSPSPKSPAQKPKVQ